MSNSSEIEENIEQDIAEEVYENDDELREEVDIRADLAESLTESETSEHHDAVQTETVKAPMEMIENFSGALAKTVVEQALLINEIHERDKLNVPDDKTRLPTSGVVANGKVEGNSESSGYDPYLMQKLLRSEADPNEATIVENFDETNVTVANITNGERYPGLDRADRYVKEQVERPYIETNDQNNNQVPETEPLTEGQGGESVLQTIHEDSELEIKPAPEAQPSPLEVAVEQQEVVAEDENKDHEIEAESIKEKSIKFTEDIEGHEAMPTEPTYGQTMTGTKTGSLYTSDEESGDDEVDCCEMTYREKKAVVLAVRDGDIDLVELLLEKRRAHIDMLWYGETLLMVAIRMLQQKMSEFLIDNDIELEYETRMMERNANGGITVYKRTARQMAFDRGMEDLVELIDYKTNNLFPFITPKEREIRIRRPRPPTPPTPEPESDDDLSHDPENEDGSQTEGDTEGKRRKKSTRDSDSGINRRKEGDKDSEGYTMTSYSDEESVHSTQSKQKSLSHKTKSQHGSHDDLSQVFGPDEGYETMSPISPACQHVHHKLEHNVVGTKDYVSIRGTKASHLLRAHTASMRTASSSSDKSNKSDNVGSYGFERKKWTYCKSAPAPKNYSMESIPDSVVRYGLPFIHGSEKNVNGSDRKVTRSADETRRTPNHRNRNNRRPSAYDEVVKVLSESRLLKSSTKSMFPTIPEKSTVFRDNHPRNLNINYIYANRGSATSSRSVPTMQSSMNYRQNSDLLLKRKLKV